MSYSLTIKAATKADVKAQLAKAFDEQVVRHQPMHARDRDPMLAAVGAYVDLLQDPEEDRRQEIVVRVGGYINWREPLPQGEAAQHALMGGNLHFDVYVSG